MRVGWIVIAILLAGCADGTSTQEALPGDDGDPGMDGRDGAPRGGQDPPARDVVFPMVLEGVVTQIGGCSDIPASVIVAEDDRFELPKESWGRTVVGPEPTTEPALGVMCLIFVAEDGAPLSSGGKVPEGAVLVAVAAESSIKQGFRITIE